MTILEAIQEASSLTDVVGLSFANIQEFNSFKDSFVFDDYPRNVLTPFTVNSTFPSITPRVKKTVLLQGWIITRISEDTNDWRSLLMESQYISPMREIAEKFVRQLLNSDIVDPEAGDVTVRILPEYMWLNDHLFGVSYSVTIPLVSTVC